MSNITEKLYTDFTTKLLPMVSEGLMITKDYFLDLFGRYAKLLLITDILTGITCFVVVFLPIYFVHKNWKKINESDGAPAVIFLIFLILPLLIGLNSFKNALKAYLVPEIRVYQELKGCERCNLK